MTNAASDLAKMKKMFLLFLIVFVVNLVIPPIADLSPGSRGWLLASLFVGGFALFILWKHKLPAKKLVVLGIILGVLAGIAMPFSGVVTILTFLAATRVLEIAEGQVKLLKRPIFISVLLGAVVGVVLGIINLFLGGASASSFTFSWEVIVVALSPGIFEEVAFRLFVYTMIIHVLGKHPEGKRENRWIYVLMIVPHVFLHLPDLWWPNGSFYLDLGGFISGAVILSLLFGLPMALLMRRRDLTSAIITHTVVDLIRFLFLGLPF